MQGRESGCAMVRCVASGSGLALIGMDTLFWFKERTALIRCFYEGASSFFVNKKTMIQMGEAPYDGGEYEDDEPPYLAEWLAAVESLDVLGLTCVSMLSGTLHSYFLAWEGEVGVVWENGERARLFKREGVVGYVREVQGLLNLPLDDCPADLD